MIFYLKKPDKKSLTEEGIFTLEEDPSLKIQNKLRHRDYLSRDGPSIIHESFMDNVLTCGQECEGTEKIVESLQGCRGRMRREEKYGGRPHYD